MDGGSKKLALLVCSDTNQKDGECHSSTKELEIVVHLIRCLNEINQEPMHDMSHP